MNGRSSHLTTVAAAFLALTLFPPIANADPLLTVGSVGAQAEITETSLRLPLCSIMKTNSLAVAVDGLPCSQGVPAFAAADLRTGKLGNLFEDETTSNDNLDSSSYAALADIITIVGPLAGRTTVGLTLTVHGSVSGVASNGTQFFSAYNAAQSGLSFDQSAAAVSGYDGHLGDPVSISPTFQTGHYAISVGSAIASDIAFTLTDFVDVDPTHRTIPFLLVTDGNVSVGTPGATEGIFNHTASLSLDLPPGLSFTSASGVLLTGASNSVPEPASLALLGTGIGIFAAMRRQARRGRSG